MKVSTLPVFKLGFRPFYLLAAIFAVSALPVWLAIYFGIIPASAYLSGVAWHSHEMVFGFAIAVISGFLLTAVRNWTGLPTPSGGPLAALALLWVSGRLLLLLGPPMLAELVDFAFLPALAVAVAIPIARSRNVRNFKVLAVLGGLMIANGGFHLAQLGVLPSAFSRISIITALDVIVILIAIVAGRVIPAFIGNAVPAARPKTIYAVEVAAILPLLIILVLGPGSFWISVPVSIWIGLLLIAAAAHIVRLLLWDPFQTRHNALLWMLPVAYAWVPIALLLRAGAAVPTLGIPASAAFHALTIGAIASLMVAMMTRSALGHTGRVLKAGPIEISTFLMLQAAAIVRVVPGIIWPQHYQAYVIGSATLWSLAFAIFIMGYWTILTRPRIDEPQ
jgi:uncharacterized protein involved in response to NO